MARTETKAAKATTAAMAAPLTEAEFDGLMAPFALSGERLAVAVSGGPDSMALAWCAKRWRRDAASDIVCFIVDHRLRPESGEEAATVRQRLAVLGFDAEILRWDHPPIASQVHALARKARYDLLIDACKRCGIRHMLLAHQREDQAETILMRFAKGSGIDGLAGMASVKEADGVMLVRPLLTVPKERLVATCEAAGIAYVTDPSNAKEKYARGRLRRVQQALAEEGFTTDRLIDLGARAREARESLDYYTRVLLRDAAHMDEAGVVRLDRAAWGAAPQAVALRALAACLQAVHKASYPPERAALLPLAKDLKRLEPVGARTIHGCVVSKTSKWIAIIREYAAIADDMPVEAGHTVLWDGRWRVTLAAGVPEKGLVVRALGVQTREVLDRLAPDLRKRVPQGRARAALPALWRDGELAIVPSFTEGGKPAFCTLTLALF